MQEQLVLSLVEKAADDVTNDVWQAQSFEQRAETLAVLGRLIAKAATLEGSIVVSEDPSHE